MININVISCTLYPKHRVCSYPHIPVCVSPAVYLASPPLFRVTAPTHGSSFCTRSVSGTTLSIPSCCWFSTTRWPRSSASGCRNPSTSWRWGQQTETQRKHMSCDLFYFTVVWRWPYRFVISGDLDWKAVTFDLYRLNFFYKNRTTKFNHLHYIL